MNGGSEPALRLPQNLDTLWRSADVPLPATSDLAQRRLSLHLHIEAGWTTSVKSVQ